MVKTLRTVVEIRDDLHGQIKRLAFLNDLRIHELTNAVISDFLRDEQRVRATIKKLRVEKFQIVPVFEQGWAGQTAQKVPREWYLEPALSFTQFLNQAQG